MPTTMNNEAEFLMFDEVRRMSIADQRRIIQRATGTPVKLARQASYGVAVRGSVLGAMGRFQSSAEGRHSGEEPEGDLA